MKRIALIGPVDKRAISYPLIKTMMFLGKVLVVADDGVYRRFSDDYLTDFSIGQSDFIIRPVIDEHLLSELADKESTYDFVLYITTTELPPNCHKILYCHGIEKSFIKSDALRELEKLEFTEVFMTFSRVEDTSAIKLTPSKSIMSYVTECEERKEFVTTKDASYSSMLETFFIKELEVPKSTIKGLLLRKE